MSQQSNFLQGKLIPIKVSMYHLKEDNTWFFLDRELPSKKGNDCAHDVIPSYFNSKTHFLLTIIVLCKCNFHNCKK